MSEYELITMHNRLEGGKLQKAERCELILTVPCGYLKLPTGEVVLDPDEQARSTVQLVFDKFDELGSFGRLYRYLVRNKIRLGMRVQRGARRGQLEWRPPTLGNGGSNAPSSDLCRSLLLRASPRRSQTSGFEWKQGQDSRGADVAMEGAPNGSTAGLYHVGPLPGQPRATATESLPARLRRCTSRRKGAADGHLGLRYLWSAHARVLPKQVDRLLCLHAQDSSRAPIAADSRRRPLMTW